MVFFNDYKNLGYALNEQGILPLNFGFQHAFSVYEPYRVIVPFSALIKYLKPEFLFFISIILKSKPRCQSNKTNLTKIC